MGNTEIGRLEMKANGGNGSQLKTFNLRSNTVSLLIITNPLFGFHSFIFIFKFFKGFINALLQTYDSVT